MYLTQADEEDQWFFHPDSPHGRCWDEADVWSPTTVSVAEKQVLWGWMKARAGFALSKDLTAE